MILCVFCGGTVAANLPLSEWILAAYGEAVASIHEGTVFVLNGGADYWHVQLTRRNVELFYGKTYKAKFSMRSDAGNRKVEVRIGRDGFPYDAFAEFGELVVTAEGKTFSRTFTMLSGDVGNARFEFNLGKSVGTLHLADLSLECLDCVALETENAGAEVYATDWEYTVIADSVNFRDNSKILGHVFGEAVEFGADSKVFGDVDVSEECFLRERSSITGRLRYAEPCSEQNGVSIGTKVVESPSKPEIHLSEIFSGIEPLSVGIGETTVLPPGKYGSFYANTGSKVKLSAGDYIFQSFYAEPDVKVFFDLSVGAVSVGVSGNVRFGDRNEFSISGGNPGEIHWNVAGETVELGTDGLYFGKFIAPNASFRISSRSHLVGGVYAHKLTVEPQSTLSTEPQASEISHSGEHFGPFFSPGIFRYRSMLPLSADSVEMFVYVEKDLSVTVDGQVSRFVALPSTHTTVKIGISRDRIPGFPAEAFRSEYVFTFVKGSGFRIFWNPQTPCKEGCDGTTAETAVGDFSRALEVAQTFGREIHMSGGTWTACETFEGGVVPWAVGFELVGSEMDVRELDSEEGVPKIDLCGTSHIDMKGNSPRSFVGFRIVGGWNAGDGGAIHSESQRTVLKNVWISNSKSSDFGGAVFVAESLDVKDSRFEKNSAVLGGAIRTGGNTRILNAVFSENEAVNGGGAIGLSSGNAYVGNAIFIANRTDAQGGAVHNGAATLNLWNSTFFANVAAKGYGAIGGAAKGVIGNCVIWKNAPTEIVAEEFPAEVVEGFDAMHTSFSSGYSGTAIHVGDPKFIDEMNPAGGNMFMDYGAGVNLSEDSPLLEWGVMNENVPETDLIGSARNQERAPLGAYGWTLSADDVFVGILDSDGFVKPTYPTIPLINSLPGTWVKDFFSKSEFSRTLSASVKKHKRTKVSSATVKVSVKNKDGETYVDIPPVKFEVYRNGEENGKYVFQSMTQTQGKPILFSATPADVGIYDNVIVLSVKENSDYLFVEVE